MPTTRRRFLRTSALLAGGLAFTRSARAAGWESQNPVIHKARQAAIDILKPSDMQIARGMQIHADALVFESYGFAPRAAIDGAAFQRAFESGASDEEMIDLREEMTMSRQAFDEAERAEFLEAFDAAGVTGIFQNTGEEGSDPQRLIKRLANFTSATDHMRGTLDKVISPDQVPAIKKAGKHCLAFSLNGVPLRQQWISVRDELRLINQFHKLGIRMMHVTYNRRNPLGDGAGEPGDGGLSDFGRAAVAEMNRVGVIVDVAHSGWRTSLEAARASARPMVASHTVCNGVHEHFRGKPDAVIKAICDTGGLIGICCIGRFLGGKGDIAAMIDHLDYAIRKFGPEHVAIGTDVSYNSRNESAQRAKITAKRADGKSPLSLAGARWEHLWPEDPFISTEQANRSLSWTNWPLFTVGLVQRGHSEQAIRKVLGENILRVWAANQKT